MSDRAREVADAQPEADVPLKAPADSPSRAGQPIQLAGAILQAKLTVGPSNDPDEREADRHADRIVRSLHSPTAVSSDSDASPQADSGSRVQRASTHDGEIGVSGGGLDPQTEQQIQRARGGGEPMPHQVRGQMEGAFGADFSDVRVHQGSEAAELNDKVQAKAFAVGHDVFFRDGLPDTSSAEGQHLLAHELTHVVQQTGSAQRQIQRSGRPLASPTTDNEVAPRIQRSSTRLGSAPLSVQRTGEAEAFEFWLNERRPRALEWTTLLRADPTPAALRELKAEIDDVMVDARGRAQSAEADKNFASRKGRITGLMEYFEARERQVREALEIVDAGEAVTDLQVTGESLQDGLGPIIDACNASVVIVLGRLRSAAAATTLAKIAEDRFAATAARDSVTKRIRKVTKRTGQISSDMDAKLVVARKSHVHAGNAGVHRENVTDTIDLLSKMMAVMKRDADAAMSGIDSLHRTMQALTAAQQDVAQQHIAAAPLQRAARLANNEYGVAKRRSADARAAADTARMALAAAQAETGRADEELQSAEQRAAEATAHATSLRKAIAIYERHLSRAPSTQGDELIGLRRLEATAAEAAAVEAGAEAEGKKEPKAEAEREQEAHSIDVESLAAAEDGAAERAALAKDGRDDASRQAAAARPAVNAATDSFKLRETQHSQEVATVNGDVTELDTARGDGSKDRTELRVHLGDAAVNALTKAGLSDAFITSNLVAVQSLVTQHGTPAAALIHEARSAGFDTAATFTAFAAQATSVPRGREVLACVGTTAAWFVTHGVSGAGTLLAHGWGAADIKSVLVAAEARPTMKAEHVVRLARLVKTATMSPADTRQLLTEAAMVKFLDLSGLKAAGRLLKATPTPTMAAIISLVKAAALVCKPTSSEFDKFCSLALAKPATLDQMTTMLKSAECTGDFLNTVALDAMHIAVTDGWTIAELKPVVKAAAARGLTKVQFNRFMLLVKTETFTKPNAKRCLETSEVSDWTVLLTCADNFIAQGNKAAPAAVPAAAQSTIQGDPPITMAVTQERARHFAAGHTYKHYAMTQANIFRGGGDKPSSMWTPTKTVGQIVGDAIAAAGTPAVIQQARHAVAWNGTSDNGAFDQHGYASYVIGVERVNDTKVNITQFFPTGASATSVQNYTIDAIRKLFGR